MDKLDEVAIAIAREIGREDWQVFLGVARAAVAVLREPTTEMLDAALPHATDWGYFPEEWTRTIDFLTHAATAASSNAVDDGVVKPPGNAS